MSRSARRNALLSLLLTLLVIASLSWIVVSAAAAQSQVVDVIVHSPGLEKNLLGDPADQPVSVYLPEAYGKDSERRFPVLYFLHGYSDPTPRHAAAEMFRQAMDHLVAAGTVQPMIIVLPNGVNKYQGAFYANSATIGNWEDYIVHDVVGYVDSHYRTAASAARRGIAGHSMGGYGALTLAFDHPEVFGSVYAMSPCCTDLVGDFGPGNPAWIRVAKLQSPDEVPQALREGQFFVAAMAALDAALAPDPNSKVFGAAPFSVEGKEVKTNPGAFARVSARLPANMVVSSLPNIARLRGIFIDYGAQENFTHIPIGAQKLSQRLSEAGISHTLEVFQGDHGNRAMQRLTEHVLPWMSKQLAADRN